MINDKGINVHPLKILGLNEAINLQFKLVEAVHNNFTGFEILSTGDLGLYGEDKYPSYTKKVEKTLADFFEVEAAILVRGAGSGAIREALSSVLETNYKIIIHDAPIYPTTKVYLDDMRIETLMLDYNNLSDEITSSSISGIDIALIQHSRQKPDDSYLMEDVIKIFKNYDENMLLVTDENYTVFKSEKIGCQLGADLSTFSLFKLFGTAGVGCVLGKRKYIDVIRRKQYSGGSKVQGNEAMECLRSMVYAPVSFAIQSQVADDVVSIIKNEKIDGIEDAYIVNAQSRVIIVTFKESIAEEVLKNSIKYGAAPFPVGSESKYEISAMFYKLSGTFLEKYPEMSKNSIRINPMRAGASTVINILKASLRDVKGNH